MFKLGKKERLRNGEGLKLWHVIGESKKKKDGSKDGARHRSRAMKIFVIIFKSIYKTCELRLSDKLQNPQDLPEAQFGRP
jgi:hypothetical protein